MKNVAEVIVGMLEAAGVRRMYGIVGDSVNYIGNAVHRSSIRFVHVRHEEAAAFAAGAEALATGQLTACVGSSGPGSLHLLNGLYESNRNRAPVIAIATHILRNEIGMQYVQETDVRGMFAGCSVFCEFLQSAEQLPRLLGLAMQTAIARRGVAVLIVPGDQTAAALDAPQALKYCPHIPQPVIRPSEDELSRIAALIHQSQRPMIFGGAGCENAHSQVMELSRKIKAPVGWAVRGKDFLEYDNPYAVGMNGLLGHSSCYQALHECDLLLLLGTSFAFTQFYPQQAKIVQIDIEGSQLGRRHWVDIGVVGKVEDTLDALQPLLEEKDNDEFARHYSQQYAQVLDHQRKLAAQPMDDAGKVLPEALAHALGTIAAPDALFTADMGTSWAYFCRYVPMNGQRRSVHSALHGTMANALSQAMGLKASHPDRQVVAMCGDGGLSMLMGELLTLVQEQLDVKVVVFNNSSLDFVSLEMKVEGLMDTYTELKDTDFAKIAQAIGIRAIRVERVADLDSSLQELLSCPGPALLDVVVNPNSLLMPPDITLEQAKGFAIYGIKALLAGEGKTLFDTLRTNFPRQL